MTIHRSLPARAVTRGLARIGAYVATAALSVIAPLACGSPVGVGEIITLEPGETDLMILDGVRQRVVVTPAPPILYGEVEIRSTVTNLRAQPVRLLANACRMDVEAESPLELLPAQGWVECLGLPSQVDIAPGDSIVLVTRKRIDGISGMREARVLHVLEPARWVPLKLSVQPIS